MQPIITKMPTRKGEKIETPFTRMSVILAYALLFLTFLFANFYIARCELDMMRDYSTQFGAVIAFQTNMTSYIVMLVFSSALSVILLELYLSVYYYFAFRHMRGLLPFSTKEFKANIRPFMVGRNLVWGLLNLLVLLPSGYFVPMATGFFETLANMITIFPCYYFMKKYYIADGFGGRVLVSFAVPFIIFNVLTAIFTFI